MSAGFDGSNKVEKKSMTIDSVALGVEFSLPISAMSETMRLVVRLAEALE